MRGLRKLTLLVVACLLFATAAYSHGQSESVGIFEGHGDVGSVLHPGTVDFDATQKSYRITGSGENVWAATRSTSCGRNCPATCR